MYKDYFGLIEEPFSIVPSSKYLFLSARHREALSHLQVGLSSGGGFAMLTGEVGTGKTTVSKAMLANLDDNWTAGLILNPTFSELELLEAICDEFSLNYSQPTSLKQLSQTISSYLLSNHKLGRQTLILIDEAQHLSAQVLEQLRLLTNLETDSHKLLKVLLIGQPELQHKLQTVELRQLAQRITGRYHLLPLGEKEVADYITFRLRLAGHQAELFTAKAIKTIASETQGNPRLINLVCDKALYYTMLSHLELVENKVAIQACEDVLSFQVPVHQAEGSMSSPSRSLLRFSLKPIALAVLVAGVTYVSLEGWQQWQVVEQVQLEQQKLVTEQRLQQAQIALVADEQQQKLERLIEQSRSPMSAMQSLYALWGYSASIVDSDCEYGTKPPFYCFHSTADLAQLVALNRPAVLTLYQNQIPYFAVLSKVHHDTVELLLDSQPVVLPIDWLEQYWEGEFTHLWYSEITQTLKLNNAGQQVQVLDELLAKVLNAPALMTDVFDDDLHKRVVAFQEWQGLEVDGVAGKRTLRRLELLTNIDAPQLLGDSQEVL